MQKKSNRKLPLLTKRLDIHVEATCMTCGILGLAHKVYITKFTNKAGRYLTLCDGCAEREGEPKIIMNN